ncbi:tetratricopeptide repeat protein [Patescibacteria group bacterium]|nr:tetratricopeptide repeat protein [Patescibacteria group bacterium]
MKKVIIFLSVIASISLIIVGLFAFKIIELSPSELNEPLSTALPKIKVRLPKSENAQYNDNIQKGDEYAKKGYATLAIQAYTLANKVFPGKYEPYQKIGIVYYENENYEKAEENFISSLKMDTSDTKSAVYLSKCYVKLAKIDEAENALKQYIDKGLEVKLYLSYILLSKDKYADAKSILEQIGNSTNDSAQDKTSKQVAAKILESFSDYDLSRGAPPIYLQALLARNLIQVEAYELAIPMLEKVLKNKNDYRDAWVLIGYSYLNSQKPEEAVSALKEALKLAPEKPETRYLLSIAYFYNKDMNQAIDNMEIALQNDFSPRKEALLRLGEMYLIAEKHESAANTYQKLLELNNSDVNLFIKPVWIYLEHLDDTDKALEIANKAMTDYPNSAMSFNLLGWVQTAKGEYTEAKKNLDKSIELDNQLDAAYLNLGLWHEKQNQLEMAKKNYKIAYEKGDGNSIANLAAIRYNDLIRKNQ